MRIIHVVRAPTPGRTMRWDRFAVAVGTVLFLDALRAAVTT
jgi:hypothetical protein